MKTPTKTLTITGNLAGDLDRLCEAYANRGWYYGTHIAHALENNENWDLVELGNCENLHYYDIDCQEINPDPQKYLGI